MLQYYHKLFQLSYRLLKVRAVNLGWLVLVAVIITMHILMLNAGLVAIKAVLAVIFTLGVPFEITLVTSVLAGEPEIVNRSDELLYQAWLRLKRYWPQLLGFVFLLLIVWLPFGGAGFTNFVINFVGVNATIADQLTGQRYLWLPVLALVYLAFVGLFLWRTPRLMIQLTNGKIAEQKLGWARLRLFVRPMVGLWLPTALIDQFTIILLRHFTPDLSQTASRAINMVVLILLVIFTLMMLSTILIAFVQESVDCSHFQPAFEHGDGLQTMAWFPAGLVVLLVGMFSFQAFHFGATDPMILSVAHRGVVGTNDVPNTVHALQKTVAYKPSYVEVDVQETKDKQFVVYHSDQIALKKGQAKRPVRTFTLAELQRVIVTQGGHRAKLTSLQEYLNVANTKGQRVMVELKVNDQSSPDLANRFANQYGRKLLANHGLVQSMNYRTVAALKQHNPELIVGYVLPFNLFSIRNLPADFYAFQAIGMNQTMVRQAHSMGAPVFVWTPNKLATMQVMRVLGTDGQITDRVDLLTNMVRREPKTYYWAIVQGIVNQFI